MKRFIHLTAYLFLAGLMTPVFAYADGADAKPAKQIPYQTSATPFEAFGSRVGWVIIALLAVTGITLYVIRKKIPQIAALNKKATEVKVIATTKLNPKSTLYVVEFNGRKLLIGQCGDNLMCLSETAIPMGNDE